MKYIEDIHNNEIKTLQDELQNLTMNFNIHKNNCFQPNQDQQPNKDKNIPKPRVPTSDNEEDKDKLDDSFKEVTRKKKKTTKKVSIMGISPQNKDNEPTKSPPISYAKVAIKYTSKPKPQVFPQEIYSDITVQTEEDKHNEYTPEQMEQIEDAFENSKTQNNWVKTYY